ncbi:hypothetical protein BB558_000346 [Smittium angustum]|uniref:SLC41A/MgtE integral membrane domain-containing protein n=1 Tax=Smittium angustum TaxID=133377 RepID=A0A2U1JEG5_SMIAN|nr:hypothetical protein BB558_000346 [Smittium angustum]
MESDPTSSPKDDRNSFSSSNQDIELRTMLNSTVNLDLETYCSSSIENVSLNNPKYIESNNDSSTSSNNNKPKNQVRSLSQENSPFNKYNPSVDELSEYNPILFNDSKISSEETQMIINDISKSLRESDSESLNTSLELHEFNDGNSEIIFGNDGAFISNNNSPNRQIYPEVLEETSEKEILIEVIPVLIFCIFGSIAAGYIFNRIRTLKSFTDIPGLYMMVPMLLNLKGNIETNLATRLATLANTGYFAIKIRRDAEIKASLTLMLLQALIVSITTGILVALLVPVIALDDTVPSHMSWKSQSLILVFTSILSTLVGSTVIGVLATTIVLVCLRFGVDSDNVSAPIVASFGDMLTLALISMFSSFALIVPEIIIFIVVILFFVSGVILYRYASNQPLIVPYLYQGYGPLIYAFVTSSVSGVLLEKYIPSYSMLAGLSPIFNGSGGNVSTIFASRLSTSLHAGNVRPSFCSSFCWIDLCKNCMET